MNKDIEKMNERIITTIDFYDEMYKYREDIPFIKPMSLENISSSFENNPHYSSFINMIRENDRLLTCYHFTEFQKIAGRLHLFATDITDYLLKQPHIDMNAIDYKRPSTLQKSYATKQEFVKALIYEDFNIDELFCLLNQCHISIKDLFQGIQYATLKTKQRSSKVKSM